ncbi:TatD family hydrolase [Neptunomonas antarctica]|uniref:Sec-independent protein translocase TatD n=1 Tax=Neptunomonas antarctica TaxID=619304 RepID=A0A1N7KJW6_9GAMM|nr:TatD family hydrolase [Neptunomonas antarctica]SIS61804.1 Sec-independent protein translocase TatD [Neptunomonas antarctica]
MTELITTELIDIGVNLTDKRFRHDIDEVIARAKASRISAMLITGTSLESSRQAIALCKENPGYLYATTGIHPHDASSMSDHTMEELYKLSQQPGVVAIGETGLDFNRNFSTPEEQIAAFERQIDLAITTKLPLFLHDREATETQIKILKPVIRQLEGAVIHCFTGDKAALFGYLDLGLYIGITGWICDERRGLSLKALIKEIPHDRLLLETDAPYLLPRDLPIKPKKGRNEPVYLHHIARTIAQLRGITIEELSTQTTNNTKRLFNV